MGEHRTGKKRTKRDGAETAKDRKKKRRIVEDAKTASDLRPVKMRTKDRKEREVTGAWEPAAVKLTDAQSKKLAETLKSTVGKDVKINATVDESLIGGLVVKVGSKMIDTSIRSRLNSLQNAMKEVG